MADLSFHPEAQAEYSTALAWYQARSVRTAARFESEMESLLADIVANPRFFAEYDDLHRYATLRRFPYSVVYQVQPNQIYVVAVAHSSRSSGYWQSRN